MQRLIGVIASGLVGYAASKGVQLDEATVSWIIVATYSGVHVLVERVRG